MRFGPLNNVKEVPAPLSGMSFGLNRDTEITELVSGGRSIYRAPTSYKSFDMSWKGGTEGLQQLVNMYTGVFGDGPFYMADPRYETDNLLPQRWASTYQLATTLNGWGSPTVTTGVTAAYSGKALKITRAASALPTYNEVPQATQVVLVKQGESVFVNVSASKWGGTAWLRWRGIKADGTYSAPTDIWGGIEVLPVGHEYIAVAISLYLAPGASMLVNWISVAQGVPISGERAGRGVGAVQFTGNIQGNLVGNKVDRIGLTVGVTEVEQAPIPWL